MSASIVIWSKDNCPFCVQAMDKMDRLHLTYEVRKVGDGWTREQLLEEIPNARSVPQIVINGEPIGGFEAFLRYCEDTGFNGTGHTL